MKYLVKYVSTLEIKDILSKKITQVENIKKLNRIGFKVMKVELTFGYEGDDFVRNLITCIYNFTVKRVPRFINPLYIKHEKKNKARNRKFR